VKRLEPILAHPEVLAPPSRRYALPALHAKLYGDEQYTSPQVLPFRELVWTWYHNRCRRVLEEDYGSVSSGPGRANAFVGSLGVSFLTA
jgi:hypothetical protein